MAIPDLASVGELAQAQYPPPHHLAGRAFVWMDRYLDRAEWGLGFFSTSPSLRSSLNSLWRLRSWLITYTSCYCHGPPRAGYSLKGYTAYQANRLLGRTVEPFWQRESYDHWVGNQEEWQRIAAYIENNPVKAGVVSQAEDYRWASAHATWRAKLDPPSVGTSADVARKSACATDTVRDP